MPQTLYGDVASNRIADTVFITDGRVIEEYAAGTPFTAPAGTPLNSFILPAALGMGPLTGLGMDAAGTLSGGLPCLYATDGTFTVGLGPSAPGTCAPPAILIPPFATVSPSGAPITDITWDPATGTFWACDAGGLIIHFTAAGGLISFGPAPPTCGLSTFPLQGIAFDLGSPGTPFIGTQPTSALYVTDGFIVAYVDTTAALAPAGPVFYTPTPCGTAPSPINGLAYKTGGVEYGQPGPPWLLPNLRAESFGQASSPGPTHSVTVTGGTVGSTMWLAYGFNVTSPGYFCPPVFPFFGVPLWVDIFAFPGGTLSLGPAAPFMAIPAPIPGATPTGLQVYLQFFEDTRGSGLGPWKSSNALSVTIGPP